MKETLYIEAIYEEAICLESYDGKSIPCGTAELIMSRVLTTMKNDDDISLSILAVAGLL